MTIYCVRNAVNGKVYIGQTSAPMRERWHKHLTPVKNRIPTYFQRAIQKHGGDSFVPFVLATLQSPRLADRIERACISIFKANNPTFGYNILAGGKVADTRRPHRSVRLSGEHRKRIGNANRGKKHSLETRRKLSEAHRGKKQSSELIAKRSEALKGRAVSPETWAKIARGHMGLKASVEVRAKMSATARRRVQRMTTEQRKAWNRMVLAARWGKE